MENKTLQSSEPITDYSEMTASWSVRYVHSSGFQCILTLQSRTGAEALQKAESAIFHLVEAKCTPLRKEAQKDNDNNNGKVSEPTVMVKPSGNGNNTICPIHGIEMTKWNKNGRTWYSHRWNDGWCNGKEQ